jgi:hypothetical protein
MRNMARLRSLFRGATIFVSCVVPIHTQRHFWWLPATLWELMSCRVRRMILECRGVIGFMAADVRSQTVKVLQGIDGEARERYQAASCRNSSLFACCYRL